MKRRQLVAELLKGVKEDARKDHNKIAQCILNGDSKEQILQMKETNQWPETYVWIKNNMEDQP